MSATPLKFCDLERPRWQGGQILAFSALDGPTDYLEGLTGRTVSSPSGIEIREPGIVRIKFLDEPQEEIICTGDFFQFRTGVSRTRGVLLDAYHLLIEGPVEISGDSDKISHKALGNRIVVGASRFFDAGLIEADLDAAIAARSCWLLGRSLPANLSPSSRRTLLRAFSLMKTQVYSPEGIFRHRWTTPDRWPHRDIWLWDTAFHAIGWRHVDPSLAMEMIEGMFDLQRNDGFLTYRGTPLGPAKYLGDLLTQPPILAKAVKAVYETTRDNSWLGRLYPALEKYVEWDLNNRDTDGSGLVEWFIEDDETCRSSESGMDNSPRFDSAKKIDAVDFNSYLAGECLILSDLAQLLERKEDAEKWQNRHAVLSSLINQHLWSEQDGFYFDYDATSGSREEIHSSCGFLPLYGQATTKERANRLAKHLTDPTTFATALPIASIAIRDERFYAKDMWRGPVWMNINWLVAEGFEGYNLLPQADYIRTATVKEIERTCEEFGTFFEYFDDRHEVEPPDLLRKGENSPEKNPYRQVIHEFGWTATLYVDLIFRRARQQHSHKNGIRT